MPRDSGGNYTLAAGNPVASGTVISTTWANPTMDDLASAMTDSLSRTGNGGMLVPFLNVDGTVIAPGITFTNEPGSGLYRAGPNDVRMAIGSDDTTRWIDASAQTVGAQQPFLIWDGAAWKAALYAGGVANLPALPNNTYLEAINFAGDGVVDIVKINTADGIEFGNVPAVFLNELAIGGRLAVSDTIEMITNDKWIRQSNAAQDTLLDMIKIDTNDDVILGVLGETQIGSIGTIRELQIGLTTTKARMRQRDFQDRFSITTNFTNVNTQDDVAMSTWAVAMGWASGADNFDISRIPPGDTVFTSYFNIDDVGAITMTGPNLSLSGGFIELTNGVGFPGVIGDVGLSRMYSSDEFGLVLYGLGTTSNFRLIAPTGASILANPAGTHDLVMEFGALTLDVGPLVVEGHITAGGAESARQVASYRIGASGALAMLTTAAGNATLSLQTGVSPTFTMIATATGLSIPTGDLEIANFNFGAGGGSQFSLGLRRSDTNTTATTNHNLFYNPNGNVGSITTNGINTGFNTSSDPMLKTEFEEITDALDSIEEAHDAGAIGNAGFLVDPDNKYPMFDGQWMAENQPNTGGVERTPERNASMDYGKRTPLHEAAIYELLQRVEHLESL